jgi:hypothetical protein
MRPIAIEPRFHARYVVTENGCWQWTGKLMKIGYAEISWNGRRFYAHQVSYLLHKGDIPEGLEIDHLCENKGCVNPDHLEAVPHWVNSVRGNFKKRHSHCKNGHPLSGDNVGIQNTTRTRYCRICNSRRATEWQRARG